MKGLIFLTLFICSDVFSQTDNFDEVRRRHKELIQNIQKQFELDQKEMDKFFNDQFFKQADQMFKQIQDGKDPFDQIIQQFQKGLDFDPDHRNAPSQWQELDEGMAFVLPFQLGPKDKVDLKINKDDVEIKINRVRENSFSDLKTYQFKVPRDTDPSGIVFKLWEGKSIILFPWAKKLEKVTPSKGDKRI